MLVRLLWQQCPCRVLQALGWPEGQRSDLRLLPCSLAGRRHWQRLVLPCCTALHQPKILKACQTLVWSSLLAAAEAVLVLISFLCAAGPATPESTYVNLNPGSTGPDLYSLYGDTARWIR